MLISGQILLSVFILGVLSTPLPPQAHAGSSVRAGHSVPFIRRSFRQKTPTHDSGSIRVFDSTFAVMSYLPYSKSQSRRPTERPL